VRATDGVTILPGRRVAMHLMAQPDVASIWMGDRMLIEQGLMSRVLATAPDPASGTRMWRDPSPDSATVVERFGACVLEILERSSRWRRVPAMNWHRASYRSRLPPARCGWGSPTMWRGDWAAVASLIPSAA
jgi:hypothetical protein